MLAAEEEASYLIEQSGLGAGSFHRLKPADIPEGDYRHIMCSTQVPDELIARLNKAISSRKGK